MALRISLALRVSLATALLCAAGCGPPPPTVLVEGRVTQNGEPLRGASVVFFSDYRDDRPASAVTDDEGRYALKTFVAGDEIIEGAFPGMYVVAVYKLTRPLAERVDSELWRRFGAMSDAERADLEQTMGRQMRIEDDWNMGVGRLSADFRFPPDTDVPSLREMLSLTTRDLQRLSSDELKRLRYPPDWVHLGLRSDDEVRRLMDEAMRGRLLTPERYSDPHTSGFTASVERGLREPLTFDFELKD